MKVCNIKKNDIIDSKYFDGSINELLRFLLWVVLFLEQTEYVIIGFGILARYNHLFHLLPL